MRITAKASFPLELARRIEEKSSGNPQLLAVIRSNRDRPALQIMVKEISDSIGASLIRSAYTPNTDLLLYEMRREDLAVVLLIVKSDFEAIVAVDETNDDEIAEIESNLYSSNINDIFIRLVSDIF